MSYAQRSSNRAAGACGRAMSHPPNSTHEKAFSCSPQQHFAFGPLRRRHSDNSDSA